MRMSAVAAPKTSVGTAASPFDIGSEDPTKWLEAKLAFYKANPDKLKTIIDEYEATSADDKCNIEGTWVEAKVNQSFFVFVIFIVNTLY